MSLGRFWQTVTKCPVFMWLAWPFFGKIFGSFIRLARPVHSSLCFLIHKYRNRCIPNFKSSKRQTMVLLFRGEWRGGHYIVHCWFVSYCNRRKRWINYHKRKKKEEKMLWNLADVDAKQNRQESYHPPPPQPYSKVKDSVSESVFSSESKRSYKSCKACTVCVT